MAEPNIPTNSDAVKHQPFPFQGDGKYRLRNGTVLKIERVRDVPVCVENLQNRVVPWSWMLDGVWGINAAFDIVARVDDISADDASLTISGPGFYRLRNGEIVEVVPYDPKHKEPRTFQWMLKGEKGGTENCWRHNGSYSWNPDWQHEKDIVAGPLADEPESAGLTGFVGFYGGYAATLEIARTMLSDEVPFIDLSTIRKDQLVPPQPKREKGWVNIYPRQRFDQHGSGNTSDVGVFHDRATADRAAERASTIGLRRIACVEIEFTVGEGL